MTTPESRSTEQKKSKEIVERGFSPAFDRLVEHREDFVGMIAYVGLAADEGDFLAFFPQAFPDDPASGFFRRFGGADVVAQAAGANVAASQ